MGDFIGGGSGPALGRLESLLCARDVARADLRSFDRSGLVAERRSGGFSRRFWRSGKSDGVRPAGCGDIFVKGDYVVRHHVHDDIHGPDNAYQHTGRVHGQLRVATILEAGQAIRSGSASVGCSRADADSSGGTARNARARDARAGSCSCIIRAGNAGLIGPEDTSAGGACAAKFIGPEDTGACIGSRTCARNTGADAKSS